MFLNIYTLTILNQRMVNKKVIYDKDMDYSFTHNMRDGPI